MSDQTTGGGGAVGYTATGLAPCEKPEKYIRQLVSHWGHKFATSFDEGDGMGTFPFSEHTNVVMTARAEGIAITLTTATRAENERMRGVVERHVDRFAFREAPLTYLWKEQP